MVKLYNSRPIVGQSFKGEKRETLPKQAMSLREILRKFVRREALPAFHSDGVYETRFGDLEKLGTMDMHDQFEHAASLRDKIEAFNGREKLRVEKEALDKADAEKAEIEKRIADAVAAATKNPDRAT